MGNYGLQAEKGRTIVIVMTVFAIMALLSVALRLQSRRMMKIGLALDDYVMIVALVFVLASAILAITAVTIGGVGLHTKEVAPVDLEYTLKVILVIEVTYGVSLVLIKTSIMALYWRLFGSKSSFRTAVYVVGSIIWAWGISVVLASFLLCTPLEFNWNPTLPGGKCANRNAAFIANGVINMFTDFMVLSLPIRHIWQLQLRTGQKVALIMILNLGLLISAISMVRVASLTKIDFGDVTYSTPMAFMWSILEEELAIITANLPLLRNIFMVVLPRGWLGSSGRNNDYNTFSQQQNYNTSSQYRNNGSHSRGKQDDYDLGPINPVIHKSEVSSGPIREISATELTDDSDTELAPHGAPLGGIHVRSDFEVKSAT